MIRNEEATEEEEGEVVSIFFLCISFVSFFKNKLSRRVFQCLCTLEPCFGLADAS